MNIVEERIKERHGTKCNYAKRIGVKSRDLSSKMRTFHSKIKWCEDFLKPLGLTIKIKPND